MLKIYFNQINKNERKNTKIYTNNSFHLFYAVGNLKAACAAVASYLLFLPADEAMLHNKDYYSSQPKVKEQYFTPREVCEKNIIIVKIYSKCYVFNTRKISKKISGNFH